MGLLSSIKPFLVKNPGGITSNQQFIITRIFLRNLGAFPALRTGIRAIRSNSPALPGYMGEQQRSSVATSLLRGDTPADVIQA
jgi:hypothetical protein